MLRARRRSELNKKKAKARRLYPHDKNATLANHLANCSCASCGNPRKYFGEETRQERIAAMKAKGC